MAIRATASGACCVLAASSPPSGVRTKGFPSLITACRMSLVCVCVCVCVCVSVCVHVCVCVCVCVRKD